MALSSVDKAIAETVYARCKGPRVIPGAIFGMSFAAMGPSLLKDIFNPQTPHLEVVMYALFLGCAIGLAVITSLFLSRQRKRDLELVRFFEKHFPDDCSWKQEEKILAAAEDLRLKAKVDYLIHKSA
jgi:hypothetical protein